MRVVIVEDESAAALNLTNMLKCYMPMVKVMAQLETISDSVEFFKSEQASGVDLIFMDIHLADGQAFTIFEMCEVKIPIIFTTAYDEYALEAFKVSSIDYLLKPISSGDLSRAIEKFKSLTNMQRAGYVDKQRSVAASREATTLLIQHRDKLIPLHFDDVAFCYTSQERVVAHTLTGEVYTLDKSLESLSAMMSSEKFYRANRQFIVARSAVKDISVWFGSRLSLNLVVETPERIIISKAKVSEFKEWLLNFIPAN